MSILAAERVAVGYRAGHPVLRDVSVAAQRGQVVAITGASGAGKTTLLWTLAGLLPSTQGAVTLHGAPLGGYERALAAGVVLMPQQHALAPTLTAAENVLVALIARGLGPSEAHRLTAHALERLGVSGQADQLVEELSGGQQQRTAIARGLALRGSVILADEVTSELDAANRARVLGLLRAEAERGAAVVLATHDPQAAAACDAQVHLSDGYALLPAPVSPH